jgi:hypothetical protein
MFHLGQSYTRFPLAKESNFYLTCVDGKVNLAKQVELKHLLLVILVSQPLLTHSDKSVELKQLLLVILVSQPLLTHSEKPMVPPCCKHEMACTKGVSLLYPTER